jgi:hypothetical protein
VLWLFVLVPMLISKRDAVRRTSDVALATRVLNSGRTRLLRRGGPAAGHRSDPDWRPSDDDIGEDHDEDHDDEPTGRSVVVAAADASDMQAEPDYLDVDVVEEDSGALPVGASVSEAAEVADEAEPAELEDQTGELPLDFAEAAEAAEPTEADQPDAAYETEPDDVADEYEYVDDSSGLEAPSETDLQLADSLTAARRRRYQSATAAAVSARKYKFRKRVLTVMSVLLVATTAAVFTLASALWWVCGAIGVVTVLYLGYLRRQTRIEERLRRRRAQRVARARLGVENTDDHEFDVVPSRLRRPGSVVLEIDDEDPIFEHLDYAPFARGFDLPHAAGQ